jgi:hypothetical protein
LAKSEYNRIILKIGAYKMPEDFGWSGNEFLMGDCMDDWNMDLLDLGADRYDEERRAREELALEFADEKGERDLCDLVREHEEEEDRVLEADDLQEWRNPELNDYYLDCVLEE